MARLTQDIYRNREKDHGLTNAQSPGTPANSRTWFLRETGRRWPFILLVLLIAFTLMALGVLLYLRLTSLGVAPLGASLSTPNPQTLSVRPAQRPTFEMDPQGEWILDELESVGSRTPDEGAPPELTAHWIKQAGVQIRNAELAFRDKNWNEAISRYQQAKAILPGIIDIDRRIGLAHLRQREFAQAEPHLQADADLNPGSAAVRCNLGVARMGQGQLETAEKDFREALRLDPEYAPAKHNLALLYFQSDRMAEASDALDAARAAYPEDLDLLHMKALALIRLERWQEAALLLEESVQRLPETPPLILFRLAEVRAHSGDNEGAMAALKQAIGMVDARRAMLWITRREFDPLRDQPEFEALALELSQAIR